MSALDIPSNFWFNWFAFFGIILGRYFITAGSFHWFLYSVLGKRHPLSQPIDAGPQKTAVANDIKLSILSGFIFALIAACFMVGYDLGLTKVYTQWNSQDLVYMAGSYIGLLLLQDTYFYFVHRLFHLPLLYRWFHQGHHRSKIPSPWTSFAFDPLEAAIQASFVLAVTFIIPLHFSVLIALLLTMTLWAVGNHLGCQVVPDSRLSRFLGALCIGSAHHLVHHRRCTRHFGLYFTFWDRLLGTQDKCFK